MIFLTGDTHGDEIMVRLGENNFIKGKSLTRDDYVIVLGDIGILWDDSEEERETLEWLSNLPFTILFIDGNHENYDLLNSYPIEIWNGGKIRKIRENIIHLTRGQVFTIDGLKFFTFGGAVSIDKYCRIENVSWWEEETPSEEEQEEGIKNLELNDWKVDYILTHTCSSETLEGMSDIIHPLDVFDPLNMYFSYVDEKCEYRHWYFGHFHLDYTYVTDDATVLYEDIIFLE